MPVAIRSGLTLNILLANTKQLMSNKFLAYSAYDNNCGHFVLAILRANNLSTSQNVSFTEQTIKHLFTPQLRKISNTITDVAGKIDIIRQGGDIKPAKEPNPWVDHVKQFAKDNNVGYFQALKDLKCKATYTKVKGNGIGSSKITPVKEEEEEEDYDPNIPMSETMEKHIRMKLEHEREKKIRDAIKVKKKEQNKKDVKEYMALSDSEKYNRLTDVEKCRYHIEESMRLQKESTRLEAKT
jgi:hypothetical protein